MNFFVLLMAIGHGVMLGTGIIAIWTWTDEHLDKVRFKKRVHSATLEAIADEAHKRKEQIEHWHKTKSIREAADICEFLYEATHQEEKCSD